MVTRTLLPESAARMPQASPLKPPKTTEWTTPSRAQASMVMGNSGTTGIWMVTRSPALSPANTFRACVEILVFFPMDSDLRLVDLCLLFFFFHYASVSHGMDLLISQSNRSNSHSPQGLGRNELTGGNGYHPPVRNRLSYTYQRTRAQGGAQEHLSADASSRRSRSRDLGPDLHIPRVPQGDTADNEGNSGNRNRVIEAIEWV